MNDDVEDATTPALPTYRTVADVLEKKNGSGIRLAGWTIARTLMIAPPFLAVGVPARKAFAGAVLASGLISIFTLLRIYNANFEMEWAAARQLEKKQNYGLGRRRR
jgi:hypothetical protein